MYKEGDVVLNFGVVEPNHCGLPWVVGIEGEYCGVIQVRESSDISHLCDALTGQELSDEQITLRINNYEFDYESKSRDCLNWRKKNQPYGPYGYKYYNFTKFKVRFWNRIYKFFRR